MWTLQIYSRFRLGILSCDVATYLYLPFSVGQPFLLSQTWCQSLLSLLSSDDHYPCWDCWWLKHQGRCLAYPSWLYWLQRPWWRRREVYEKIDNIIINSKIHYNIVMGEFKANVGPYEIRETCTGPYDIGTRNRKHASGVCWMAQT